MIQQRSTALERSVKVVSWKQHLVAAITFNYVYDKNLKCWLESQIHNTNYLYEMIIK